MLTVSPPSNNNWSAHCSTFCNNSSEFSPSGTDGRRSAWMAVEQSPRSPLGGGLRAAVRRRASLLIFSRDPASKLGGAPPPPSPHTPPVTHTLSHSHTLSHTPSHTHPVTHTLSHAPSLTHPLSHTLSHTPSLSLLSCAPSSLTPLLLSHPAPPPLLLSPQHPHINCSSLPRSDRQQA